MVYRLRLARVNNLKLKVATNISAQLVAGDGIDIARANGVYTVSVDTSDVQDIATAAALVAVAAGYQPLDSDLTAIAALTTTSYGRAFLALADAAAGRTALGGLREVLSAVRTYYVRTDGSDSNTGLADTSGAALLTPQAAWNKLANLDQKGFTVTLSVRGSFNGAIAATASPTGPVVIVGTSGTPANDIVGATATIGISLAVPCSVTVQSCTIKGSYRPVEISNGGAALTIGSGAIFNSASSGALLSVTAGSILSQSNFTVQGSADGWLAALGPGAYVEIGNNTITVSGTPAWVSAGITFTNGGVVSLFNVTFSGSATGKRYSGVTYGVLQSFGAGTLSTYFPGNSNGTAVNALQL